MAGALVTIINELSIVKKTVEKDIKDSTNMIEQHLDYVVETMSENLERKAIKRNKGIDSNDVDSFRKGLKGPNDDIDLLGEKAVGDSASASPNGRKQVSSGSDINRRQVEI